MEKRFRKAFERKGPSKEPYSTALIVCEGEKTEPNYFTGLCRYYRLSSANIAVTHAPGTDPMSIVTHTEGLMAREHYDQVFSVFDRDGHANFDQAVDRVRNSPRGQSGSWGAITSTPCFEVWLMLHFRYSTAPIVRAGTRSAGDMAVRALTQHLNGYQKGMADIYTSVAHLTDTALANSRRLSLHNTQANSINPATEVHVLVDFLQKIRVRW